MHFTGKASQRSNMKDSKSGTGAQISYSPTALSEWLEDNFSCSSTPNSKHPSHVFEPTPDLLVRDEKYPLNYGYRIISSKAKQATLSHTVGQESLARSESVAISTLHNKQRSSSSISRTTTFSSICANLSEVAGYEVADTSIVNEHFTPLLSHLKSLPGPNPLAYQSHSLMSSSENLYTYIPPHDRPPPDSDIAQLWEEVKSKVTKMIDLSKGESESIPSFEITSKPPRQPDMLLTQGSIKRLPSWVSNDKDPDDYLEIKSIIGNPQFSYMPEFEHKISPFTSCSRFCHMFIINLLHRRPEALGCLQESTKTQTSSDSTQQENSDVAAQSAVLRTLDFISTASHSEEAEEHIFSLELQNTLGNMGWPQFALSLIPSTLMGKQRCGPSFLHLLFSHNRASSTVLANWKSDAQREFTNQLRLSRVGDSIEKKRNVVSGLKHFCYLIEDSDLFIWEMEVEIKPPKTLKSTTTTVSSGSMSSEKKQVPSSSSTSSGRRPLQQDPKCPRPTRENLLSSLRLALRKP